MLCGLPGVAVSWWLAPNRGVDCDSLAISQVGIVLADKLAQRIGGLTPAAEPAVVTIGFVCRSASDLIYHSHHHQQSRERE